MARCPGCNKFPALETEAEMMDDATVNEGGSVTAEVRLVRRSECCSEEIKEYTMELEGTIEPVVPEGADAAPQCTTEDGEHVWELDGSASDAEVTDRYQTHDRHGKPIKRMRYQRHYIGAQVEVDAVCTECGAAGHCTLEEEITAGSFEELV